MILDQVLEDECNLIGMMTIGECILIENDRHFDEKEGANRTFTSGILRMTKIKSFTMSVPVVLF